MLQDHNERFREYRVLGSEQQERCCCHQPIVTESCTVHTAHYCTPVHLYSTVHWTLIALRQDLVPLLPLPDHYKQDKQRQINVAIFIRKSVETVDT